jgi:hypothetical protein
MERWFALRKAVVAASLALALVCLALVASGQTRPPTTIGVEEITPGMRGYGLTVFRGTDPERFEVEVIDVLQNFQPDMDLILVRTDHPILDHASTVAGMSGSPIYLDGRLAGAYAYGWSFGKDPIAGVTPISSMLAEMNRPVRPNSFPNAQKIAAPLRRQPRTRPTSASLHGAGLAPYLGEHRTPLELVRAHATRFGGDRSGPRGLERASTPLMLAGFSESVTRRLSAELEPYGLMVLQAGGGGNATQNPGAHYVDGGAIGVQLVRGDISATAIGTVTHVNRRRVLAFGHPMMNAGEVGLPTSTARVLHILASESRSFKIAEAGVPLGTLIHDRQPTIVIDPELEAETVPVHLHIEGLQGAPRTDWNMEVASHRVLTPLLAFAAMLNALEATAADQADIIYTATGRVTIEGYGDVTVVDRGYSAGGAADGRALASSRIFDLMEIAYGNPFVESRIRSIDVTLALEFSRDIWEILDASVASDEVDPGSTVQVRITMRKFGQRDRTRVVPVEIPMSAAGETVEVAVTAGDEVEIESPIPRSIGDLVTMVRTQYSGTDLVVSLKRPSRGLRFQGHVVRDLPRSALDALQLVNDTDSGAPFTTYDRERVELGELLTGTTTLSLRVREIPRNR